MDEAPEGLSLSSSVVAENAAGAAIGTLTARDPEGGALTFTVDDARFEVQGDGTLKLKDGISLDYEAEPSVTVTVTATDAGGNSSDQAFTLTVTDVDEAPEGLSLSSSVVAENAAGAAIGTLTASDPEGGALTFTVDDARFEVQGYGTLKLKDGISLDYEAEPSVTVTVTATDAGGNSSDQAFTLTVTDVDEAPEGLSLSSSVVAENAAGAAIGTLTASDPEGGALTFTVDDARFEVQGDGTLKLKDGISLDYEAEPSVTVTVTATDAGGNSSDQAFTLTVSDADEDAGTLSLDNTTLSENDTGAAVGVVSSDAPGGGPYTFTVDDARFEVQGDGTLKLKDGISLDYEAEPSVTVTVTATDAGGNSSDQAFTLTVTDVDEAPEGLSLSSSVVAENAAGAAIGTLTASDPEGGALTFTVDDARFEVQGYGTLKLKDGISLDYEAEPSVTVTVTATDAGGNSSDQAFTLTVTDVDEAPEGLSLSSSVVAENAAGAAIGTLTASDPEGGAITFTVDDARFEVQGDGTLKLKDGISLDYEAEPSVTVTVTATDAGGNSSDQAFTLTVTDVDEAPEGLSLSSSVVAENAAGAAIGTLTASDPEGGALTFTVDDARFEVQGDGTLKLKDGISLDYEAEPSVTVTVTATDAGGNSSDQAFTLTVTDVDEAPEGLSLSSSVVAENAAGAAIGTLTASDPEGGALTFTVDDARFEVQGYGTLKLKDGISLDYEAEPSVTVTVTATDAGGNSSDQAFTLTVTDVDEAPEGLSLSSSVVAENAAGAAIGTLTARDPEGGALTFTVDDARFEVQGDGTLKLKDGISLDYEAEPSVTVTVTATDAGGNSSDQAFTLTVTDVDEAPEGLSLSSSVVAENAAGAAIGTLTASDPEGGALTFTVDDARFEVQGYGTLKLKDGISLDYEAEPSVTVTVTATDAGGNSSDQAFTLTVTDVDEAPEGLSLSSSVVAENAAGAAIGTLTASDPEGGALTFTVDDARFEVQGDGTLKLKDGISLDYEAEPSVTVTVTATDAGGNSSDQAFTLTVSDADEDAGTLSLDNTTLSENDTGAAVGVVSSDAPGGGPYTFTVDDARFEVQGDGTLKLKDGISLDYEAEPSVTVTVTATDAGGNSSDQAFTLTVTDVDEAPEGLSLSSSVVAENAAGAAIGTLTASDPEGGALTFTVDDARFEVQGYGTLKLKDGISLDYEAEPSVTVTVTATDAGGNSSDQAFTLTVTDVDEAPEGLSLSSSVVAENAAGAAIGTLTASDPEGGAITFTVDDARFEVQGDGTLKLKDGISLDYEAEPSVTVTVTATDAGGNSSDQAFTLTVTDVDEAPEGLSLSSSVVAENAAGAAIGTLTASDPEGGALTFTVDDARFEVQGDGTLKLKDGISLDYEAEPSVTVTVTATDAGGNSSDQAFTLTVTDVDEAPEGLSLSSSVVAENAAGAAIGTLTASDPEGGALTFTVDDARFEVQGYGTLKLKDGISLDYEAEPSVTVTVTATDAGGNSSDQAFTLTVTDVDEAPEGLSLSSSVVAENAAGAAIGTLTASDPEGGALTFTVDDARFEVQGDGTLKLKDGISLDYEAEPSVTVTVTATDAGGNSSDQAFTLTVSDADEDAGTLSLDNTTLSENDTGAAVGVVSSDAPGGGPYTFTVDDARFEVQGDGTLKLKDGISLDYEAEPSVTVTVTATDAGGNSSDQAFTLTVSDVDEAPEGLSLSSSVVAENAAGTAIGTLTASDPEGGALTFTVDDARFEVQGDGTLKLKDGISLDYEAEPSVTVTVTATDAGGNSSDQAFTLTVTDVDEAPEGLSLSSSVVAENAAGAAIGTLTASDPEGGALTFTVDDARFEVQGDGTLKLKDGISLDYEAEPSVTVTVTATDAGGNSSDQQFNISVTDVPVVPATVTVNTSFHVEQIAVVDGVLNILDIDYNSDPLDEIYTQTIDFPSTPFTFFDLLSPDVFATKVTGRIDVSEAGSYEFRLTTGDTAIVWIDGVSTIVKAVEGLVTVELGSCSLSAGEHEIVIYHLDLNGDAEMSLEWRAPGEADFSLVTPSPHGSIENNDDAGFIVDIDTGTSTLEAVKLTGVPDNWIFSAGEETAVAAGGEIDVTGWDLSQLVIAPASDDLGTVTLDLETTLRSPDGEVETSTTSFDVNVVPEDGILLDLDIDLGIIGVGLDLGLGAGAPDITLAANVLAPDEELSAPFDGLPVTPVEDHGLPALF
ncbi:PA14 domain-containing protein [Phaeobacter sp. LSS9]|uniref:PA14 domain-containing protein n=1 Tax=unclassified Phaeobacter TaxID=2621772 RepID=UPI0013C2F749|nr:PA14 domain-containing protein [Phaeobacter sp. LSS9]